MNRIEYMWSLAERILGRVGKRLSLRAVTGKMSSGEGGAITLAVGSIGGKTLAEMWQRLDDEERALVLAAWSGERYGDPLPMKYAADEAAYQVDNALQHLKTRAGKVANA